MSKKILAIDAGTSNVRALIIGTDGRVLGKAKGRYKLDYPAPGLVEQDPEELWSTTVDTISQALSEAGLMAGDLSGLGITGQRATTIVWERGSGLPLGPAISWQDQRGEGRAKELSDQGFITVTSITSACKLEGAVKNLPGAFERMRKGDLAWGNVDSFLAWRLSGGAVHATDCSNACTTGYYDYLTEWRWNEKLIEVQDLDPSIFPEVVDTAGRIGLTSRQAFGAEIPIGAIIGDQQSAAYGQGCLKPGDGKVTFGTSATCDVNTGHEIKIAAGSYPLVLWRRGEDKTYCVEGMVITAGAVFDWLAGLGVLESAAAAADVAASVPDAHGVFFLPALQGLGSPHSLPQRHGAFEGLTLGASAPHLVRAAMEGVAFRVREMLDRVYEDCGLTQPDVLRVDGGAASNDVMMQIQANILGRPVERMMPLEATAFGAALLAGEACGVWEPWTTASMRRVGSVFEPQWKEEEREERFAGWRKAWQL
jgi:glycerol kinase